MTTPSVPATQTNKKAWVATIGSALISLLPVILQVLGHLPPPVRRSLHGYRARHRSFHGEGHTPSVERSVGYAGRDGASAGPADYPAGCCPACWWLEESVPAVE